MNSPLPSHQLQQLLTEPLLSPQLHTPDYGEAYFRHYIISFQSPKSKHSLMLDFFLSSFT